MLDAPWAADPALLPDLLPIAIAGKATTLRGDHRAATFAAATDNRLLALGIPEADIPAIRAGLDRSPHHAAHAIEEAFTRLDPHSASARAAQAELASAGASAIYDGSGSQPPTVTRLPDGTFRVEDADGNEIGTALDADGVERLVEAVTKITTFTSAPSSAVHGANAVREVRGNDGAIEGAMMDGVRPPVDNPSVFDNEKVVVSDQRTTNAGEAKENTPRNPSHKRKNTTTLGVKRNNPADWRATRDLWDALGYEELLSPKNRARIAAGRTPKVDANWVSFHPEDAGLLGEIIIMHHIKGLPLTAPLPATRHGRAHLPGGFRYNPGNVGSQLPIYPAKNSPSE